MPIKLNGTTFNNGGTAKFNGTTLSKIVFNSTTVWEAERLFYPGTTVQHLAANAGSYGDFYTNVPTGQNNNSTVVYIPVNLTGVNSITITGSFKGGGGNSFAGVWLRSQTKWNDSGYQRYPYYTIGQGSSDTWYTLMYRVTGGGTSTSVTWDVSSYSGTFYIAIGCYNNSGNGTASVSITKIKINS